MNMDDRAAERWALVKATSRFGKWSGLGELLSRSGQDYFPRLATYDLSRATYASDYIGLRHKEVATVDGDPARVAATRSTSATRRA